jgi:hypothetical protein
MTPERTETAKMNLREGIKKMAKVMSPAAQVRRDFRLGRPPKPGETLPLHRMVVWHRASEALSNFRARMAAAKLNPKDVEALIVYIENTEPDTPRVLLLEEEGKTPGQCQMAAFKELGRDDVIAIGMLFRQFDTLSKQQFTFPYQFVGLNERGVAVLKKAAMMQVGASKLLKDVN